MGLCRQRTSFHSWIPPPPHPQSYFCLISRLDPETFYNIKLQDSNFGIKVQQKYTEPPFWDFDQPTSDSTAHSLPNFRKVEERIFKSKLACYQLVEFLVLKKNDIL